MTQWLKKSTAVTIKAGPFLDETDGKTPETGLTITQADIRLSKIGGDISQSHNAAGATHDEAGYYDVPLDVTDTDTLGSLRLFVNIAGALPVWHNFMIVSSQVWDSLFGTDLLEIDPVTIDTQLSSVHGSGRWGGGNGGDKSLVYTLTDSVTHDPVSGATVELYATPGMTTVIDSQTTNVFGVITFSNLVGGTYYLKIIRSGYETTTDTEVVS